MAEIPAGLFVLAKPVTKHALIGELSEPPPAELLQKLVAIADMGSLAVEIELVADDLCLAQAYSLYDLVGGCAVGSEVELQLIKGRVFEVPQPQSVPVRRKVDCDVGL